MRRNFLDSSKMKKQLNILVLLVVTNFCFGQTFPFDSILKTKAILKNVNANSKKYRLQIIYTQIGRSDDGKPSFTNYYYLVDSAAYFYPASLVKLPVSILALEKTKKLRIPSNTIMFTDSANSCQHSVKKDATAENGYPSVAQYIKRMALVSDNFAYGRVYEFLGVDYIHNRLFELGYKNVRIVNRFDNGCKGKEHTTTNPVTFYKHDLKPLLKLPQQVSEKTYVHPLGKVLVGKAHLNSGNRKINAPKDFSEMNYLPLKDVHSMLQRLIFHDYLKEDDKYDIIASDRQSLIQYLTMLPRESTYPNYNTREYYDSYKKYFIYGDSRRPIADSVTITNIVGQSFGFMVDCAYIQNKERNIEFMLSAVIYANEDGIINDGKYEYNTIALPFLAELGRQMYSYEFRRKVHADTADKRR